MKGDNVKKEFWKEGEVDKGKNKEEVESLVYEI